MSVRALDYRRYVENTITCLLYCKKILRYLYKIYCFILVHNRLFLFLNISRISYLQVDMFKSCNSEAKC